MDHDRVLWAVMDYLKGKQEKVNWICYPLALLRPKLAWIASKVFSS